MLVFVVLSTKVRYKLLTRPLKITIDGLSRIKSKTHPFFSSGVLYNVTPDVNNAVQGSINTSDIVDNQLFVSPSDEPSSDYEVITTPDSSERRAITPAIICNEILQ